MNTVKTIQRKNVTMNSAQKSSRRSVQAAFLLAVACLVPNTLPLSAYARTQHLDVNSHSAASVATSSEDVQLKKSIPDWYLRAAHHYGVSWPLLAAVDVYGATTRPELGVIRPKGLPIALVGYRFPTFVWQGLFNPVAQDSIPDRIQVFDGRGIDGDRDGKADQSDPYDRVSAIAKWLKDGGPTEQEQMNILWHAYYNPTAVERIQALANVFKKFSTTQLGDRVFPLHKRFSYSYRDTWGEGRNFGGRRIHEGTDMFASYGTPVLSTCYGYIELIGWNRLGGWRIGLRSADNTYFYYAHLSSYARGIKQGVIVRPGQVLGYVGSSGYGRPGTSGKFPPHLHFGIYKDTGTREWAFDPYPLLRVWEHKPQVVIRTAP